MVAFAGRRMLCMVGLCAALVSIWANGVPIADAQAIGVSPDQTPATANIQTLYGQGSLSFIANAGQFESDVRFEARSAEATLFFQPRGSLVAQH